MKSLLKIKFIFQIKFLTTLLYETLYFSVFEPHFLIMKISTIVLLPFELAFWPMEEFSNMTIFNILITSFFCPPCCSPTLPLN